MVKILEFTAEYGFILLAGLVSVILLGYFFVRFIKYLIANPKGALKAVLIVIGVLAALIVPALFLGEDLWTDILYGGFLLAVFIVFAKYDPKGAKKIVFGVIAAVVVLVVTGFAFGIHIAVAVGVNGVMALLAYPSLKYLIENIGLERNGIPNTATVIGRTTGRSAAHIVRYTDAEGNSHEGRADIILVRRKENGSTFDILCDRDAPGKFCVKTVSLVNSIIMFAIMFVLQVGTLGLTVYLLKEMA